MKSRADVIDSLRRFYFGDKMEGEQYGNHN